jgi:hypothetical protein
MARKFFVGGVSLPNLFSFRSNHPLCVEFQNEYYSHVSSILTR